MPSRKRQSPATTTSPSNITLRLPWPPTVNTYWRHANGRTYISAKGRSYRNIVQGAVLAAGSPSLGEQRLFVEIDAYPPDKRRRDLDNILKAVLDSLEESAVFDDDGQIDELHIRRQPQHSRGTLGHIVVRLRKQAGEAA